jgi:hypothetical protein
MLLTVPAMWLACIWMLLYVIHSQLFVFGPWMNLYFSTFIDLSFLALYITMIFVLFDKRTYAQSVIGRCCVSCCAKIKKRKEEKDQLKKDVKMVEELQPFLDAEHGEEDLGSSNRIQI